MTKDEEGYQGWTNRPTWIVNLWLSNEEHSYLYWRHAAKDAILKSKKEKHEVWTPEQHALFTLEDRMRREFQDQIPTQLRNGVYRDLLNHVIDDVNFKEIAEHWITEIED